MKKSSSLIILVFALFQIVFIGCQQKEISNINDLDRLLQGNKRFLENHPIHPDQTLERLRNLKKGQHPFAVIVSCSDSRLPTELVFDQGLGDLFVIRNAGNIISDYELGSIEYAVEHLDTKLIVVLGHTECGAIGAFIEHQKDTIPNHIQKIIDYLKEEPEEKLINEKTKSYYDKAVDANIIHGVEVIKKSEPILAEFIKSKKVKIVGMKYHLNDGSVTILENEK
ncbi:MAG: carbonic anhydrase [Flavobacteriia bacterium]|nr:carbonic anhydrase [Flavobacteriia bacterium]OIP48280.1 MAG: carbonic anhydrase [Flavobacteriaceae bacterium CG2_30_31_66]PIV96685.1 MAG: carbonic anhydrase [Flavobacteriaceae bacterium CG17_big_fil_post_rev_8_21_14_2_50_31_13]PIX12524.1 MAG: carbonic anhydrase [Flavobacteriaceae bacterium CG_4_8_14_3_um_filter_31_8]PIY14489.1 MAG: carbonic anhydrase [Flavobacteriaceae bacterium CG_4_10_14_3_um_filter_31_253]PIZ10175.1 MAG: carbonic anhydrase [Flavobacteriaceae bacterium CG_4_10_14_0_8_um_f